MKKAIAGKGTGKFRQDINGLRAWAVLVVVLYHFGVPFFDGGFVGVDIFFVISGFLMTSIIVNGLDNKTTSGNEFSIWNFYLARAKRIIPALAALCMTLMALGWLVLSSLEYSQLSVYVISAISFISNILFSEEAGYFDSESHEKLLLHTWSLSVEWQFYLILPIFLVAMWKLLPTRKAASIVVFLGLVTSLLISAAMSVKSPTFAFYMIHSRAWEMLAGGLVYLNSEKLKHSKKQLKLIEFIGLSLIIFAVLTYNAQQSWPGWRATIPVIGAMLVIYSSQRSSLWTGNRVAQWFGSSSYSLYLWHWPIVVTLVYFSVEKNSMFILMGLGITLVLGSLSYMFIENTSRARLSKIPNSHAAFILAIIVLLVALPSVYIKARKGVPTRNSPEIEAVFMEAKNKNPRREECHVSGKTPVPGCTYGGKNLGVIVIGDSHADSIMNSVQKSLPSKDLHVLAWSLSACPTIFGIQKAGDPDYSCSEFLNWAFSRQKELDHSKPMIIINRASFMFYPTKDQGSSRPEPPLFYIDHQYPARTAEYNKNIKEAMVSTACKFAIDRKVYMVRPIPNMQVNVPKAMGRALTWGRNPDVSITLNEYRKETSFIWEAQDAAKQKCGIEILDPTPYLCNDTKCEGAKDGLPIYFDDNHLNERGAALLTPMFSRIFEQH